MAKNAKPKKERDAAQKQEQIALRKMVTSIFTTSGFIKASGIADQEFIFDGTRSDFDDAFICENVIVFVEYTVGSEVSSHLKKKKVMYDKIMSKPEEFLSFAKSTFPEFENILNNVYHNSQFRIKILYCSRQNVSESLKSEVPGPIYFDYHIVQYFKTVCGVVKRSARFELMWFLGLADGEFGPRVLKSESARGQFRGSLLPESHSSFPSGFKLVSFYADPETLLRRCYVLRKDGWNDAGNLYQRMISKKKVDSIREYLATNERVFINNIIVTLPKETIILDQDAKSSVEQASLKEPALVTVQVPDEINSIGLIDGQHRVFSYHEGGEGEDTINVLRKRQNLLVTGIIYPDEISPEKRMQFEAKLFLEINSTQSNAKSDLKQTIQQLIYPFHLESIAAAVLKRLNEKGPLADKFVRYFFDRDKLKTSSIVSYGLKPILKFDGSDSLFFVWDNEGKTDVSSGINEELLNQYIDYCWNEINKFFSAMKLHLAGERWTASKLVEDRALTTTSINGFIICLRKIAERGALMTFEEYKVRLEGIDKWNFLEYKSSQYAQMGEKMFIEFFSE